MTGAPIGPLLRRIEAVERDRIMDQTAAFFTSVLGQFQSPALAFLLGGMVLAACRSKLQIPSAVYQFAVFMLLVRIGLNGGMAIREADLLAMLLPVAMTVTLGLAIVGLGAVVLPALPGVRPLDGYATAGLFGAVSASTLAAAMVALEAGGLPYEPWTPALYPFMDIPALLLAIVLANLRRVDGGAGEAARASLGQVVRDSLRGSALSALLLGLGLGLVTRPDPVFQSFYDPLFRGFLSVLMLVMGMEAWERLSELRRVAHWYAVYAVVFPIVHGAMGFGLGWIAHHLTGLSPGGVVILAVLAASSSDISGPPTLRAAIPEANPSAYIGASTAIGTPVAIVICIPLFIELARAVFGV